MRLPSWFILRANIRSKLQKRSKTEEVNKELDFVERSQSEEVTDSDLNDSKSIQSFGEFDPDEFEILDEVGEEDDSSEERRNDENLDAQISLKLNQDYGVSQNNSTNETVDTSSGTAMEVTGLHNLDQQTDIRKEQAERKWDFETPMGKFV